jgi:hypothetical protein
MMMPGGWGGFGGIGGGLGGGAGGYPAMRRFEEQYHVYSVAFADKSHLEVSVCVPSTKSQQSLGVALENP